MNNRNELRNEYQELTNKLNSTNRKTNQKTEVTFSIGEIAKNRRNLAVTVNFEKYLSFGEITYFAHLIIDPYFEYQALAKYIKVSIKDSKDDVEIISAIRLAIDRLFAI